MLRAASSSSVPSGPPTQVFVTTSVTTLHWTPLFLLWPLDRLMMSAGYISGGLRQQRQQQHCCQGLHRALELAKPPVADCRQ